MKIRMRTLYAGPIGIIQSGEVLEMNDSDAAVLVKAGAAECLDAPRKERAEAPPEVVERSVVPQAGRRN